MQLKNKKVLITGADGFIGSHLTERLVELGADVTAMAQYNSFNTWGWLEHINEEAKKEIKVYTGDIREYDSASKAVAGQDVVLHLAALIAIPYSYQSPAAYVRTNVEGTLNVLEACKNHGIEKMVHTSTSEVYGTALYAPIDEKHPLQGQSPYSASKIGADKMAESYYRSFGVPVTTLRPFNTYGPRQSARAVIPTIISQIMAGAKTIKLGSLTPTRDFNFVRDTAEGFVKAVESDRSIGEVISVGSGKEIAIGELAKLIIEISGRNVEMESEEQRLRPEKSEVNRLLCDNSKAMEYIGWKPQYTLKQGLTETIEWIGNNLSYFKTDIYNV